MSFRKESLTECWTGLSDEEMLKRDPELAKEIIRRREKLIAEFESKKDDE